MRAIVPTFHYGFYSPGDWMSRYGRMTLQLPAGRRRLCGRAHNPEGADLDGNRLQVIVDGRMIAEVQPDAMGWTPFSIAMPLSEEPGKVDIVFRTTRFREPPPPDVRLLGLILDALTIEIDE